MSALNLSELPRDAVLTYALLLIGATGTYVGVPLVALPIIMLLPGYALSVALFPSKEGLSATERLVMSIGLNVSLVASLAAGLDILDLKLWDAPLLLSLISATALFMLVSIVRRRREDDPYDLQLPEFKVSSVRAAAILLLIMAVAMALSVEPERPVEFYLTDDNGIIPSESWGSYVKVVVANHAGMGCYRVDIESDGRVLESYHFTLKGESSWATPISIGEMNNALRLNFTLYSDGEPIRRLHLLRVQERSDAR